MTSKGNKPIARDPKKTNKLPDDTEDAVDSFLTEIESDIRDDQLRKLWFKYKNLFYGSMVALVLFVGSYQVWEKTEELDHLGIFNDNKESIKIIEWPDLIQIPLDNKLEIYLKYVKNENEREIEFVGLNKWASFVNEL